MSRRQEKMEDKRGSNNLGGLEAYLSPRQTSEGFLPSDPSPRWTRGFCHQILLYGPYADGLPWACYLRPAASSQTYSAASSWTHPVPAPSHCPAAALTGPACCPDRPCCSCPSASDRRNIVQRDCCRILVVTIPALRNSCFFLSFLSLAFPSPSPQSVIVSVLPFPHLPY